MNSINSIYARKLFLRAGEASTREMKGLEKGKLKEYEVEMNAEGRGVIYFKRMAMGFCGVQTRKTPEEFSTLLRKCGMAGSPEKAREVARKLEGAEINYGFRATRTLSIRRDGEDYVISAYPNLRYINLNS